MCLLLYHFVEKLGFAACHFDVSPAFAQFDVLRVSSCVKACSGACLAFVLPGPEEVDSEQRCCPTFAGAIMLKMGIGSLNA